MDRLDFPENCLDVLAQYLIGLVIINDRDIDEAFEIVKSTWSYRNLDYDEFIEVLDMLDDERRVWIDWEENLYGKRGYSRMIYYTNIGTIAPDNSYLVFNAEGSILGQLSSSFVANLRNGDVILLGGSTYRVTNIQGTRVNVTTVTGYRPTVPSWSGEARGRSRELSKALLDLIGHTVNALRKQFDPLLILKDVYGLSEGVANTIARHLQEHTLDSFQVPDPNRIIIEEVVSGGMPTYMITSCRGRGFNTAFGYFMAGLAEQSGIAVLELSFDENGLLFKTSQSIDPAEMLDAFRSNNHIEVIERYIVNTQIFAKRFREVAGRSLIIPKRIGAEEVSPQQFQQRADSLLQRHRSIEDSLLIKEAKNEILFGDIDIKSLSSFLESSMNSETRIVHSKVVVPSKLGMSLYMSSFEDLLSMKTRAFLVKDIDPEILRRLLGNRSLATELTDDQLQEYYSDKVPKPTSANELLDLMKKGGGLDRNWENPLYQEKLKGIEHSTIEKWVKELAAEDKIRKIRSTGSKELDDKWFADYMAEIHGTLGCIAGAGGKDLTDIRDLYTKDLNFEISVEYDGLNPTKWVEIGISDPHEALRVKIIEMLGSEGPRTGEYINDRLPFPQGQIDSILHELEMRNVLSVGFYKQTDDAEYILKVDEHRITGGDEEVLEYRWIQNLVMQKSFKQHDDGFSAFNNHILFQKQQEMMSFMKSMASFISR